MTFTPPMISARRAYRDFQGRRCVQALSTGKIDAVIIDNKPAQVFVDENDGLKLLETPYAEEEYAIAVKKGNTELLDAINASIANLEESGKLDEIVANTLPLSNIKEN